ncbi:MAG: SPOR domain-containing protein [Candidatus Omnitrophica bacterium]|nr:SPOR domain-containing protein [Candidatus Omnitrophota bacterium]
MEREAPSQLELFSQVKDYGEKNAKKGESFFSYMRNYEKQIILLICFFITAVASFALGIEKGKRLTAIESADTRFDTAKKIDALAIEKLVKMQPARPDNARITKEITSTKQTDKPSLTEQPKASFPIGGYTIQVASYRTKDSAEKEALVLRKRGFSPLVLSKGSFSIVCVGNFNNKKETEPLLSKLRVQYQDCYIRRL